MTINSKFLKSVTLAVAGAAVLSATPSFAKEVKMEKCFGIVKAGKNDCASVKKGGHSCAGSATVSGDKSEWVLLPTGTCERLVNGSLKSS